MASRLELHQKLLAICESDDPHVYFQPPESVRLKYPCIIYHLTPGVVRRADDMAYNYIRCYDVLIIDSDPDVLWDKKMLESFKNCSFSRSYASDNLNHWAFRLYY